MINSYGSTDVNMSSDTFKRGRQIWLAAMETNMASVNAHVMSHVAWKIHFLEGCKGPDECPHESPGADNIDLAFMIKHMISEAVTEVQQEYGEQRDEHVQRN